MGFLHLKTWVAVRRATYRDAEGDWPLKVLRVEHRAVDGVWLCYVHYTDQPDSNTTHDAWLKAAQLVKADPLMHSRVLHPDSGTAHAGGSGTAHAGGSGAAHAGASGTLHHGGADSAPVGHGGGSGTAHAGGPGADDAGVEAPVKASKPTAEGERATKKSKEKKVGGGSGKKKAQNPSSGSPSPSPSPDKA